MVRDGSYKGVVDLAESLGAHAIQVNEIRPAGNAAESDDRDIFLTRDDKDTLIEFLKHENASPRPISIAMPWFLEEPDNLGCTATSAQKVYIDAHGHVQPCELLKVSLGNILERDFDDIWREFRERCRYPVRDCIVWNYREPLAAAVSLPLAPAPTAESWTAMTRLPVPETYAGIYGRALGDARYSLPYFERRYALGLQRGVDYHVRERHWLPARLNVPFVALGRTLYASGAVTEIPRHEFLHLAQFRRFGVLRVFCHYLWHGSRRLAGGSSFGQAFGGVPFEEEARAYERLAAQAVRPLAQVTG
jgi:hypothetical protein